MDWSKITKGYYYLAPLWFLVETFAFPGIRIGLLTNNSIAVNAAFYGIETIVALCFWYGYSRAEIVAMVENVIYLVLICKFILMTPLDIALQLGDDTGQALAVEMEYHKAIPGMIYSMFNVGYNLERWLHGIKGSVNNK